MENIMQYAMQHRRYFGVVIGAIILAIVIVSCNSRPNPPVYTQQYSEVPQYAPAQVPVQQVPQYVQQAPAPVVVDNGPGFGTGAVVGALGGFLAGRATAPHPGYAGGGVAPSVNHTTINRTYIQQAPTTVNSAAPVPRPVVQAPRSTFGTNSRGISQTRTSTGGISVGRKR